MKIKLSRERIVQSMLLFEEMLSQPKECDCKFNYAIIKNKEKLRKLSIDIDIEFKKLDLERNDICIKYCEKDENGKCIYTVVDGKRNYKSFTDEDAFKKEYSVWQEKAEKYKNEEIEVDYHIIKRNAVPQTMIGVFQEAIMPFLEKEETKDNEMVIN